MPADADEGKKLTHPVSSGERPRQQEYRCYWHRERKNHPEGHITLGKTTRHRSEAGRLLRGDAAKGVGHANNERNGQRASDNSPPDEPSPLAFVSENIVHRQIEGLTKAQEIQ